MTPRPISRVAPFVLATVLMLLAVKWLKLLPDKGPGVMAVVAVAGVLYLLVSRRERRADRVWTLGATANFLFVIVTGVLYELLRIGVLSGDGVQYLAPPIIALLANLAVAAFAVRRGRQRRQPRWWWWLLPVWPLLVSLGLALAIIGKSIHLTGGGFRIWFAAGGASLILAALALLAAVAATRRR